MQNIISVIMSVSFVTSKSTVKIFDEGERFPRGKPGIARVVMVGMSEISLATYKVPFRWSLFLVFCWGKRESTKRVEGQY
jgi:hypothetical protein